MKILKVFITSTILIFINSCGAAQNNASERNIENMLLDFYSKHFYIWENTPINNASPVYLLHEKLDSLMQKYCTSKLRSEAKEILENVGADLLTNNLVGQINENLRVEKDTANENSYFVSFMATYSDAPGGQTKKQVVLNVTVVKEGNYYKINSVE